MTTQTRKALLEQRRMYLAELERQKLEKEVKELRKKANPGLFDKAAKFISDAMEGVGAADALRKNGLMEPKKEEPKGRKRK